MNAPNEGQAQSVNEPSEVMTFQFSESQTPIRNVLVNGEPFFVGSDIAKALGYKRPADALRQHCRYSVKHSIPHPQSENKVLKVLVIPESDMYRLVINSTLPTAEKFERWVMEDVLPSIRKKGYYKAQNPQDDFIEARDIPCYRKPINGFQVRCIDINGEILVSLNDLHKAIHSSTGSNQAAKKLNRIRTLANKVWTFGNTHPAWFVNQLGVNLILSGSRILNAQTQLNLSL